MMPDTPPFAFAVIAVFLGVALLVATACTAGQTEPTPADPPTPTHDDAPTPPLELEQDLMQGDITVRTPAVAGSWYPGTAGALAREIDAYLDAAGRGDCDRLPLVLVAPHAGYSYSGSAAGQVFAQIRGCAVRRVWLLGPSHRMRLRGVGLYPVDAFRTPIGDLPLDRSANERLAAKPGFQMLARGDGGEHSIEIELPFLQRALGSFELVPLLMGQVDPALAAQIAEALRAEIGPGDLVVVSSDFTHYGPRFGYEPFAGAEDLSARISELDHGAWELVANPDPEAFHAYMERTDATICGRAGLLVAAALVGPKAQGTELVYANSGEQTGDWENAVSYLGGRLDGPAWSGLGPQTGVARLVSSETAQVLLKLARQSLEHWYAEGKLLQVDPASLPADAQTVLGAFVTLEKHHQLRGCIGEITPRRPIYQAVIERAVDAAIHDPRFDPVRASELPALELDVSLLGPTRPVPGPASVIVGRHGVVISRSGRSATFLPQVGPEQGWDRDTMLLHLARKAGLPASAIPDARIEVYEAQVVRE